MIKKYVVNSLTFLRILFSVLFGALVLRSVDPDGGPMVILLVIFASDILDGKLARRWNVTTRHGAIFDVTADMFFVAVSFVALILHSCKIFRIRGHIVHPGRRDAEQIPASGPCF